MQYSLADYGEHTSVSFIQFTYNRKERERKKKRERERGKEGGRERERDLISWLSNKHAILSS